ncbi:MAG: Rpn family recombination-promoting nuclease/putative transposase [Acetatifactor sp.]|nr:Rpn family recombination-promoting nuclease/putative transposase [Acetatifactor sp.]
MPANGNNNILNSKLPDSSSKLIFDEPILCAQFLRGYINGIPCLKDVRPEDIEDVSEQYVPLFAEERNSDRVKKIHIKNGTPFFLVSLIEHKTKVEYNVTMQIFRYMVYIWESYEREEEKREKGISRRKDFRYPPILPIVYYEGRQEWTVPLDFRSRITEGNSFSKYIPDFQYYLVPLRKYSNEELLDRADEISLVMLVNKLQELGDISSFRSLPQEKLETALKDTPDHIADIIADILLAFLLRSKVPVEMAEDTAGKVREKKMGELFADMEPIDIPAEQAKLRKQWQELGVQKQEFDVQKQELDVQKQKLDVQKQELDVQKQKLNVWQQEIYARQQQVDVRQQEIYARQQQVDAQKQKLDTQWSEVNAQQQKMETERQLLEAQKLELEIIKQELKVEREKLQKSNEK